MIQINISLNTINGILQYLGNRPYVEVVGFIDQIKKEASMQNVSATNVAVSYTHLTLPTIYSV